MAERPPSPFQWMRALLRPRPVVPPATAPAPAADGFVPAGHYYSPIPSAADIDALERRPPASAPLPGIVLDDAAQLALLEELAQFYPSMPFTSEASPGLRYRFDNPSYGHADGVLLHAMLRWLRPARLIEVGSGYTSALSLDTNERFLDNRMACTFIEPHPELLFELLTAEDRGRVRIVSTPLQEVDLGLFDTLQARDVLFVDSTHVSKVNSDVNRLFFEILPRLAPGTFVHIHDVFPGFEYPLEWLRQGRAWNEQYLLRAFLEFNDRFAVRLFGSYMVSCYPEWFRAHMPHCLTNPGGAFWMERVR